MLILIIVPPQNHAQSVVVARAVFVVLVPNSVLLTSVNQVAIANPSAILVGAWNGPQARTARSMCAVVNTAFVGLRRSSAKEQLCPSRPVTAGLRHRRVDLSV